MDEQELAVWLDTIVRLSESGRVLSAANRAIVEEIQSKLDKLAYNPQVAGILEKTAELLKSADVAESATDDGTQLQEREFTADQRKEFADKGWALPGGEYPIETKSDLSNAIAAFGRATNPAAVKRHIIKRARALGATDMLPEGWLQESTDDLAEAVDMGKLMKMCASGATDEECVAAAVSMGMDEAKAKAMIAKMRANQEKMAEGPVHEAIQIIEAVHGSEGREWDVILIESGLSKNGNYYPKETLKAAVPLFEGAYAFADHATDAERQTRPERSVKDKVGRFVRVEFGRFGVAGRVVEGLKARFKVLAPWLREVLVEAMKADEPDFLGFSIDAEGTVAKRAHGGRQVMWVEKIIRVHSVDVVTDPAAGGRIVRLVASNTGHDESRQEEPMTPEEMAKLIQEQVTSAVATALKEAATPTEELKKEVENLREVNRLREAEVKVDKALAATTLSDLGQKRIRDLYGDLAKRREFTDDELALSVNEQVGYEAAIVERFAQNPAYRGSVRAQVGDGQHDKFAKALTGWFTGSPVDGVPAFRTLKEAYCRWTDQDYLDVNPVEMFYAFATKYDSALTHKRVRESLTTASWGDVFADQLYVNMMREYKASPYYDRWRLVVSEIENVPDFQTRHYVRVGGYGDLSTVAEGGTYGALTSPTDEVVNYAITKRGGLDDATLEMLSYERGNTKIRSIPKSMARSAARTLWKYVMNLITTDNPTLDYDSTALYTSHNNSGTTALSINGLNTTIVAMRDQTAYSESNEILGARNLPKYLIVPNELEQRARRIVGAARGYEVTSPLDDTSAVGSGGTGLAADSFWNIGLEVLVYDQLTDATDWWAMANPAEVNTVVMGFWNGQTEPELFVQDNALVGSVFSADKITWKIRHVYAGDVLDHRSFYRQVVT